MGVCGADPVAVLDGGECLSAPDEEELNTLRRLGFAKNTPGWRAPRESSRGR
jgi:hypothetical protein